MEQRKREHFQWHGRLHYVYQEALIPVFRLQNNLWKMEIHNTKTQIQNCVTTIWFLKISDVQIQIKLGFDILNPMNTHFRLKILH